jgi:thiamine-monophosphate kinase
MGQGGEFDLIRRLMGPDSGLPPEVLLGPGDDCAVFEGGWVLSTDLFVEGVHFKRNWITLEEAGFRATAAALSDLAAMAARPVGVLLSLALDPTEFAADGVLLQRGAGEICELVGTQILGGDLSRSPGPVFVNVVALGRTESPVSRAGTGAGDELWVTGRLGGSAGALAFWNRGEEPPGVLRECFARPQPRIREAQWLADRVELHGLIDLSDGLAGDAGHLAAASGLAITLESLAIPGHPSLGEVMGSSLRMDSAGGGALAVPDEPARASEAPQEGEAPVPDEALQEYLRLVLAGGEDFELAFTVPSGALDDWVDSFQDTFGIPVTRVGRAEPGDGVRIRGLQGKTTLLNEKGFSHFPSEEDL